MSESIDVEHSQSTAVALRPAMAVGQAMQIDEIIAQVNLIQQVMRKVMTEGEHYGSIPGCGDKKTLLQPGAQKLTMTFRLAPEYQIQEVNLDRGHKEYRVVCTLKSIQSGSFVGQGVGCCSSMESKYRWRAGVRKCPKCGKESIIKGKEEYGGGWLCWKKKDGCGATWPDGSQEIESQSVERIENDNPADTFNTVLKIAKKRAFVDATITATAASDIFTQDIGDNENEAGFDDAAPSKLAAAPAPSPKPDPKPAPKQATAATLKWMREQLHAAEGEPGEGIVTEYFQAISAILPTETLADLPLNFVPTTKEALNSLSACIGAFENGDEAVTPTYVDRVPADPQPKAPKAEPAKDDEPWRSFPMPFGKHAGIPLGELDKKYLYGLVMNYKVETEYNGKAKKPEIIAKDRIFRSMLDACKQHYGFKDNLGSE